MKRWILGFALLVLIVPSAWADGPQGNPPNNLPSEEVAPPRHQPRFRYSSYGVWVRTNGPGYPAYRYTYRGQKDNFPLPAIFQSGMEHSNYTWGTGF